MILDYLDTVRSWPIPRRKRFAMTISVGLTGLIVLLWLSVLFMGPEPQQATTLADRPVTPVSTEQEPSGMWGRLRASIGMAPGADSANPPSESSASQQISPEALSEFHNTFEEPVEPVATASTTETALPEKTIGLPTQTPVTAPEPEDGGSMVESVLEEVER